MNLFDDLLTGMSNVIYNGCLPSQRHDQLAGELIKARLLKASDRFDQALVSINNTLNRLPNHPEALFLKAQILCDGFADYPAAAACLRKVIAMKSVKDETIRRWSQNLLLDISQQMRLKNNIS